MYFYFFSYNPFGSEVALTSSKHLDTGKDAILSRQSAEALYGKDEKGISADREAEPALSAASGHPVYRH